MGINTAITDGLADATPLILAAGGLGVGASLTLMGGKKAFQYFKGLWSTR